MTLVLAIENLDGSVLMAADSYCGSEDVQSSMASSKIMAGHGDDNRPSRRTYLVGCAGSLRAVNLVGRWLRSAGRPLTHQTTSTVYDGGQEAWVMEQFVPSLMAALEDGRALEVEDGLASAHLYLLVAVHGYVYEVDANFGVARTERTYAAVGTSAGICAAYGSLYSTTDRVDSPGSRGEEALNAALDVASKEIRRPWHLETLLPVT